MGRFSGRKGLRLVAGGVALFMTSPFCNIELKLSLKIGSFLGLVCWLTRALLVGLCSLLPLLVCA